MRLLDSALLVDKEAFTVLEANDSCERLLQCKLPEIVGRSILGWVAEPKRSDFEKALRIARRRYYPREWDSDATTAQGSDLAIRASACLLSLSDGTEAIQVLLRDISKEREAEIKIASYIQELEVLNRKLEELSITDEMTKLFNFRHFKKQLQNEHERSARYKRPYSIVFFDADNFKHYNDRNGHPAGDDLLRQLAKIIQSNCRGSDFAARYGGEEFVMFCPETELDGAMSLAERLRQDVEKYPFAFAEHQPLGRVSVSIGVASYPLDGKTPEEVLEAADQGVYFSKHHGRNQVTASRSVKKGDNPVAA